MNRLSALSTLAILLLLCGAGTAGAVHISADIPVDPIAVGQTAQIPLTITGADQLTSLTLQIGSSSAAEFDQTQHPLGGIYTFNPDKGLLVWMSPSPVSGDNTVTSLTVTPRTPENIPVEISIIEATARPASGDDTGDITDRITITKNIIIPVQGAETTATIVPVETKTPVSQITAAQTTAAATVTRTAAAATVTRTATSAAATKTATAATVTKTSTAATATQTTAAAPSGSAGTTGTTGTAVPTLTQASTAVPPLLGLIAVFGLILILRREP